MTQLRSATALITGAAGGFGRQLTRQLLASGSRLVLSDLTVEGIEDALRETPESDRSDATVEGEIVASLAADLSSPAGCHQLFEDVTRLGLEVDILINNAGIAHFGNFADVPEAAWQRLLQVNLHAPMLLSQLFNQGMIERQRGHVLNISSAAGWAAAQGLAAYSATKFALRGFSDSLRQELAPHGVRVSTVYPFFARTPILEAPQFGELYKPPLPERLTSDPADVVAAMVRGLADDIDHIFPDPSSRRLQWLVRYAPRLVPWLHARLQRRLEAQAPGVPGT